MRLQEITDTRPRQIDISEIEVKEGPYTMSYGFDLSDLKKSILKTGLIHPPILIKSPSGNMSIVAGYRRIFALRSLGEKRIFYIDLSDKDISPFDMLLLNLYDNLMARKLNDVEIGMAIKRLSFHISTDMIMRDYAPHFGIKKKKDLDKYMMLEKADKSLKNAVSKGEIPLKIAMFLIKRDAQSRKRILGLIIELKLSFNYQNQLIDILDDISIRNNISIPGILDSADTSLFLNNEKLNKPQKTKKLFHYLRSLRYPIMSISEETFKKTIAGLNLPRNITISHPPFFESGYYRMEILFRDGEELHQKLLLATKINGIKKIKDPWIGDS